MFQTFALGAPWTGLAWHGNDTYESSAEPLALELCVGRVVFAWPLGLDLPRRTLVVYLFLSVSLSLSLFLRSCFSLVVLFARSLFSRSLPALL